MPVPVSPRNSTATSGSATRRTSARTCAIAALSPISPSRSASRAGAGGIGWSTSTIRPASSSTAPRSRSAVEIRHSACTRLPSTSNAVAESPRRTNTDPGAGPGSRSRGFRLRWGSASGSGEPPPGGENRGTSRDSFAGRPEEISGRATRSPTRRRSGWAASVSPGTREAFAPGVLEGPVTVLAASSSRHSPG
ncbi:MAG TPA: hypothetical protein VH988_19725 [Thermoanaerobaculia bacterium]|nr:hypothetical protein [Thermoanaerobaculia bacterium]